MTKGDIIVKLFCIEVLSKSELEIKKSKFIAYLMPYSLFNVEMKKLKEVHSKARHFVYAYRYLNEYDQIVENQSDDGEPKGSSGKPTLTVLQGNALINSAIIIVRYFGGTRLGIGGLVRAYGDATNLAINESNLIEFLKKDIIKFFVEYSNLSRIEYIMNNFNLEPKKDFIGNGVEITIEVTEDKIDEFKNKIKGYIEYKE